MLGLLHCRVEVDAAARGASDDCLQTQRKERAAPLRWRWQRQRGRGLVSAEAGTKKAPPKRPPSKYIVRRNRGGRGRGVSGRRI